MTEVSLLLLAARCCARCSPACGGGGSAAKLAGERRRRRRRRRTISKADFDALIAAGEAELRSRQGQAFPKPGTADYETIKGQAVTLLVQQAEREQKATDWASTSPTKQIETRLDADQEAVLRRQPEEVPGAAEEAGLDRRAGARRRPRSS